MLRITACIASLAGALFLAAPAAAAPGGNGGSTGFSSITLVQPNALTTAAVTGPAYGDVVTFAVTTNESTRPWVNLKCYQGRTLVAEGWDGFFVGALGDRLFGLYSPTWTGGDAECTAALVTSVNGRYRELASTSFHVTA